MVLVLVWALVLVSLYPDTACFDHLTSPHHTTLPTHSGPPGPPRPGHRLPRVMRPPLPPRALPRDPRTRPARGNGGHADPGHGQPQRHCHAQTQVGGPGGWGVAMVVPLTPCSNGQSVKSITGTVTSRFLLHVSSQTPLPSSTSLDPVPLPPPPHSQPLSFLCPLLLRPLSLLPTPLPSPHPQPPPRPRLPPLFPFRHRRCPSPRPLPRGATGGHAVHESEGPAQHTLVG